MGYSYCSGSRHDDVALGVWFLNKELMMAMDDGSDIYTTALDIILAQINLITYSNTLSQGERLGMLDQLEVDVSRKLGWARASFSFPSNKKEEDALMG